MASDWSDEQNDAIVADYFAMLADDIAGRPYSKSEHNRLLQPVIDRPRGSIEYKHQNISAVLISIVLCGVSNLNCMSVWIVRTKYALSPCCQADAPPHDLHCGRYAFAPVAMISSSLRCLCQCE